MDCVNHSGVNAAAYCQNCGKALCAGCVRNAPGGQIFCEPCWTAWQSVQPPFVAPPAGAPHPVLAALLGLIPGVGAMYNGQFIKGLVHVVIFAVLVSAAHVYGVFGLFIAGWIFYQVFEAYHTAKARRDGEPLPDPLGLNEVSNWFSPGGRAQQGPQPGTRAGTGRKRKRALGRVRHQPGPIRRHIKLRTKLHIRDRTRRPGYTGPGIPPIPPIPPVPPVCWRRREPIGAVILIALGLAVSGGAVGLVLRPAVSVRLAGTADRFGRVADRAAPAGHAWQFARRAKMSRYILIRRLRWPAILLLIGVLALLHQAGVIAHFWRLFWPLLLIMLGLLLLAERAALAAEGDSPLFRSAVARHVAGRRKAAQSRAAAGPAGTAIVPSQPHDFENDVNGGQS